MSALRPNVGHSRSPDTRLKADMLADGLKGRVGDKAVVLASGNEGRLQRKAVKPVAPPRDDGGGIETIWKGEHMS